MSGISYLGLIALILLLGSTVSWFWLAIQTRIPQSLTTYRILWVFGLVLGGVALLQNPEDPFAQAAVSLGVILVYLIFTGKQRSGTEAIKVGQTMPGFITRDDQDNTFDSTTLHDKRVLLKFFRGHW